MRLQLLSTVTMGKGCMCTRDGGPAAGSRRAAGAAPLDRGWGRPNKGGPRGLWEAVPRSGAANSHERHTVTSGVCAQRGIPPPCADKGERLGPDPGK